MPLTVHSDYVEDPIVGSALRDCVESYSVLVDSGMLPEEARQVLPNACTVNLMWTVNARSLLNFFEQRLCKRNVKEMQIVAQAVWQEVRTYWPDFADLCGPYCYTHKGKCNQGSMSCGVPYTGEE